MLKKVGFLFLIAISMFSCGEERTLLFDMEFETDFDIPAGLNTIETWYFEIDNVQTFFDSYASGIDTSAIGSIAAASCTLDGKFGVIDYDFIQDIYINGSDPSDLSSKRELFYREDIPFGSSNEIVLFGNLANMKEVINNDLINLEVRVNFRYFTPSNLENRLTLRFQAFEEE